MNDLCVKSKSTVVSFLKDGEQLLSSNTTALTEARMLANVDATAPGATVMARLTRRACHSASWVACLSNSSVQI